MYIMIYFHRLKAQTLLNTIEHPIRYVQVKNIGRLIVKELLFKYEQLFTLIKIFKCLWLQL
jgi:hypothetical protein